jgi:hypothetical protein
MLPCKASRTKRGLIGTLVGLGVGSAVLIGLNRTEISTRGPLNILKDHLPALIGFTAIGATVGAAKEQC